ncbi:plasmid mobilization relaxosome protein MobC [Kineosporia sp. A_224]|uniref:plasmid mobilization relaxosome protein MobC n=1 Tax=Kineosporia sp. A_224 TaxID=1962180 RepID=UPI000B4AB47A|nr:plasmid mobilization relaxosome protein MobC [Kineosporia sp. A_224]
MFRLSGEERDRLRTAAGLQGQALGRFVAEAALDRADGIRRRFARLAVPPRELLAVQIELREVARQVRAVGVNVNQVAAVANSEGVPPANATAVLAFCGRVLGSASAALDRVDRLAAALGDEASE